MQEERTMLAKELSSLRDQREQLKAEVEKYRECDCNGLILSNNLSDLNFLLSNILIDSNIKKIIINTIEKQDA